MAAHEISKDISLFGRVLKCMVIVDRTGGRQGGIAADVLADLASVGVTVVGLAAG
jgi:hypothetical protein